MLVPDWQKLLQDPKTELAAHYKGAVKQINRDFKKLGLDFVPEKYRLYLVVGVVVVFLVVMCYSCCSSSEIDKPKKQVAPARAASASGGKREKLE